MKRVSKTGAKGLVIFVREMLGSVWFLWIGHGLFIRCWLIWDVGLFLSRHCLVVFLVVLGFGHGSWGWSCVKLACQFDSCCDHCP